jgi:spermidine synthase
LFHVKQQPITLALASDATLTLHASAPPIEVRSSFQHISVEHTASFGQLYRLDGDAMAAEADEFMIHESLAHLAALEHPSPRRAIILGGGDGASARELLKHPSLTRIVVAELDPLVVSTLREHIRSLSTGAFDDRRVELCIGDAARSLKALHDQGEAFDLILFDLTETDDPACAHLHDDAFLALCAASLGPAGIAHVQLGSPFYQPDKVRNLCQRLRRSFANVRLSLIHAPLYGGPWLLARCRTQPTPGPDANLLQQRLEERGIRGLRYYNPALHLASEALPNHLRDLLA